jgi:hypothetical protein
MGDCEGERCCCFGSKGVALAKRGSGAEAAGGCCVDRNLRNCYEGGSGVRQPGRAQTE